MSPERFVKGESDRTLKNLASIFSSRVSAAYLCVQERVVFRMSEYH